MRTIISLSLLFMHYITIAQEYQNNSNPTRDTVVEEIYKLVQDNITELKEIKQYLSSQERFKLYPTQNIYTFLLLDTMTGKIEQVQWSLDVNKEGSIIINNDDLSYGLGINSRCFELYPTQNMYQFILLNKINGYKWHVQWGNKEGERWIRRIY